MTAKKFTRPRVRIRRRRKRGLSTLEKDAKPPKKLLSPGVEVETDRGRRERFGDWETALTFAEEAIFPKRGERIELVTRYQSPLSKMLVVWDSAGMLRRSVLLHEV